MRGLVGRFAGVAVGVTVVDVALLCVLRLGLGWPLIAADLVAIGAAAVTSYLAHRTLTFRNDPFVRWVYQPWAVAVVVLLAAAADLSILVALAGDRPGVTGVVVAKVVALAAAAALPLLVVTILLLTAQTHLLGRRGPALEAYARLIPPGIKYPEPSLGRIVTSGRARRTGALSVVLRRGGSACRVEALHLRT